MTDFDDELDRRLQADAARHDAADVEPPSLADALAAATARRRVPLTWLAVAATVLLVAGLATAIAFQSPSRGIPDIGIAAHPPYPSGVPVERGSEKLFYFDDAGFNGVVLDPDDPRVLGVVVPYSRKKDECSLFGATVRIVSQDADTVQLRASGFQYLPKAAAKRRSVGTSCFGNGVAVVRVRLNAPLGRRHIEESFQRAPDALGPGPVFKVPADPSDLPSPSYLPGGYAPARVTPASLRTGQLVGQRYYAGAGAKLVLEVGPPGEISQTSKSSVGRGRIGGTQATITAEPHMRCISWGETSGRVRQLCSYADPTLGNAELLRIARSVR